MPTFTTLALERLLGGTTDSTSPRKHHLHTITSPPSSSSSLVQRYVHLPFIELEANTRTREEDLIHETEIERDDHTPCSVSVSHQFEFYDADEEFFSDGSVSNASPSFGANIEVELHASRVNLFDEIEKRKKAENDLAQMRNQWNEFKVKLSQIGLSFPAACDFGEDTELDMSSVEQFCQEVVVARFVSEAIARGQAQAEAEAAAGAIIKAKDQEISRLHDKLQYFEAVNHEMSQRNQEVVEVARRQQLRRKKIKRSLHRWMWSCLGISSTVAVAVLAYSYLPETSRHISSDSSDGSLTVTE